MSEEATPPRKLTTLRIENQARRRISLPDGFGKTARPPAPIHEPLTPTPNILPREGEVGPKASEGEDMRHSRTRPPPRRAVAVDLPQQKPIADRRSAQPSPDRQVSENALPRYPLAASDLRQGLVDYA